MKSNIMIKKRLGPFMILAVFYHISIDRANFIFIIEFKPYDTFC